jgi:hypothetical protein
MEPSYPKEGTQERRVLDTLLAAEGAYIYSDYFIRERYLTQVHRAIYHLEHRFGWTIERAPERNEHGFMGYAIKVRDHQLTIPLKGMTA